ncbi:FUSC family protein [Corynebacterium flavescens]|uniref:Membrane protein n=2 Tax=Corynebacterium flavescens TaxID=28028 RepID=A0A1L7CPB6_CORFL|nr:FUSC family protein [Corynebacterium flavescens]APT87696.1 membrane protein [Corynebacterium flavescens]MDN6098756.1 FUSC family protein [Corynebacterium flavescens]MDN6430626.1 FUSC family protein [Corynebacterium flavescens]MDN6476239.1 FUSC family protein [Corynebacterium flavescens]MDN6532540.1 FUSC family protein [Corynebacterium flavescens]
MTDKPQRISTRERLRVVDQSVMARVNRLRSRSVYIIQATVGAGLAYWVAHVLFGHSQPFFAPISAVIILGLSGGDRMKKALEMSIGGIIGVAVGDILFEFVGQGPFQITLIVLAGLIVGSFITKSPLVANQIVFGSILIATIFPPTEGMGGLDRAVDAMIGSAIGIVTIALIPNSPLSQARREICKVLGMASSVLSDVSYGLRNDDPELIEDARDAVRGTQSNINSMLDAAKSGREAAEVSPIMWASRRNIRSLERILEPVDNAVRGVRVLSRRAMVLSEDHDEVSKAQLELIDSLSDILQELSELYNHKNRADVAHEIPEIVSKLRKVGARASMGVVEEQSLSAYAILAQTRSIVVDLLMVCGMSRESAVASLVPTSAHPAFPSEVWSQQEEREERSERESGEG